MLYAMLVTLLLRILQIQFFLRIQRRGLTEGTPQPRRRWLICSAGLRLTLLEVKGASLIITLASAYNGVEGRDEGESSSHMPFACVCFVPGSFNLSNTVSGEGKEAQKQA